MTVSVSMVRSPTGRPSSLSLTESAPSVDASSRTFFLLWCGIRLVCVSWRLRSHVWVSLATTFSTYPFEYDRTTASTRARLISTTRVYTTRGNRTHRQKVKRGPGARSAEGLTVPTAGSVIDAEPVMVDTLVDLSRGQS